MVTVECSSEDNAPKMNTPTLESLHPEIEKFQTSPIHAKWPNLIAYWLLGLCNNYGYVVMLSAAHDILGANFHNETHLGTTSDALELNNSIARDCNPTSTGAILLADILPSLIIKLLAPFFIFSIHWRVLIVVLLSISGYLLVALSTAEWMAVAGVVVTSLGSGLGEVSFLSYSSYFDKNVVSTWSSGTGGAGIFGASSYLGLTLIGISPSDSLLIMLVVPALMAFSFWVILQHPKGPRDTRQDSNITAITDSPPNTSEPTRTQPKFIVQCLSKLRMIPPLLTLMIPLGGVYLFEYFINQGLFELVNFNGISLSISEQYRLLQMMYQIGVFISRSSVNIFTIRNIWILAILQLVNVVLFTFEAIYLFIPYIWIVFVIVLWEGLLGGAAYVNTFYRISIDVPVENREFSMGITSLSDALGITLAGFISIPVHNALCKLPRPN